ncbi:MAG: lysine exporter LysO family protein [Oceanospirillaceae bacterium]|nr:lysine exporter LysO family protein [Oceanospirillaceae bacterium]
MTILMTLGPLLGALILGFYLHIKRLSVDSINMSLKWLTFSMLGLIGYGIGALEDLADKLYQAGVMALVLFALILIFNIVCLVISGRYLSREKTSLKTSNSENSQGISWSTFSDSIQTVVWVVGGALLGFFTQGYFEHVDALVTWMLYLLLFLVGQQLHLANYRLRSLFLNVQGLMIALITLLSTLLAAVVGAWWLDMPVFHALAVASGFGWYSLSGILLSDLGYPLLGTTSFLLDIGREIAALMLIPLLAKMGNHCTVGVSGATAMDFTLPMLGKFHGSSIIPTAIASGFVLSILVPVLIPLFMSFS